MASAPPSGVPAALSGLVTRQGARINVRKGQRARHRHLAVMKPYPAILHLAAALAVVLSGATAGAQPQEGCCVPVAK